ncbi:MAG TPA: hypothetical protein VJB57_21585 [Dehalococcoidia bacterium]|nr:hypothetical protein [Dehalococcoidia bacterium]
MTRRLILLSIAAIALLGACSDDHDDEDGSQQSATAPAPAASRWSSSAVWDYYGAAVPTTVEGACKRSPPMVQPGDPCVIDAMRNAGASTRAIDFYEAKGYFLASFQEQGRIDYGQGGAFWINMGRPTPQLFLNGSPDIIEATIPDDYKTDPTYADVIRPVDRGSGVITGAFPWLEYGRLASSTAEPNGGQRLVIEYPLRACRACPDLGYLPVAYGFDAQGRLGSTQTLPLRKP